MKWRTWGSTSLSLSIGEGVRSSSSPGGGCDILHCSMLSKELLSVLKVNIHYSILILLPLQCFLTTCFNALFFSAIWKLCRWLAMRLSCLNIERTLKVKGMISFSVGLTSHVTPRYPTEDTCTKSWMTWRREIVQTNYFYSSTIHGLSVYNCPILSITATSEWGINMKSQRSSNIRMGFALLRMPVLTPILHVDQLFFKSRL